MNIQPFAKFLYGFFGVAFIIIGASIVLLQTPLLPTFAHDFIYNAADGNVKGLHLLQEFGCMLVFAGLTSFWAIKNYAASKPFHSAMTTFWALLSLIHWFDIRGPWHSIMGPIINSIPVALFAVVGVLRRKED